MASGLSDLKGATSLPCDEAPSNRASFFLLPSLTCTLPTPLFPLTMPVRNFAPPRIDGRASESSRSSPRSQSPFFFFLTSQKKNFSRENFAFTRCGGFALYCICCVLYVGRSKSSIQ
jgi:hypothetical protein